MAAVHINRSISAQVPLVRLWAALRDPEAMHPCAPLIKSIEPAGDERYALRVELPAPVIGGTYRGTVRYTDVQPMDRLRLIVDGKGRLGKVRAEAEMILRPDGSSTAVDVTIRGNLSGLLGGGAPVANALGASLIDWFFGCLNARLQLPGDSPTGETGCPDDTPAG